MIKSASLTDVVADFTAEGMTVEAKVEGADEWRIGTSKATQVVRRQEIAARQAVRWDHLESMTHPVCPPPVSFPVSGHFPGFPGSTNMPR